MSAPRLLVGEIGARGVSVVLPAGEARHVRSRRLADGVEVVLLDGRGARARARLAAHGREAVVLEAEPAAGEPARRVTLVLACAEPARVEWAVEKGTECGAAAFRLALCERSQRAHAAALAARLARLSRIAAEAVKQCDRTCVPAVAGPEPLAAVVASLGVPLYVARRGAARPRGPLPAALAAAIGPEGGFTDEEEALLARAGATPFGLGPRVLRLETAAVAALSFLVDAS